jgi:hypothetical protein
VIDEREIVRRAVEALDPPEPAYERLRHRRDRKRRNQRITAGVVGIAVFVAAVWIVTSGLSLDRSETPAATGPAETGPVETGPTETGPVETGPTQTAPAPAPAPAAPDVVRQRTCSDGARSRLEQTDMGDRIKIRFEVYQSPVGHEWRIRFRFVERNTFLAYGHWFFRGTRVASDSGVFAVQLTRPDWGDLGIDGKAVDRQTGQVCEAFAWGP